MPAESLFVGLVEWQGSNQIFVRSFHDGAMMIRDLELGIVRASISGVCIFQARTENKPDGLFVRL